MHPDGRRAYIGLRGRCDAQRRAHNVARQVLQVLRHPQLDRRRQGAVPRFVPPLTLVHTANVQRCEQPGADSCNSASLSVTAVHIASRRCDLARSSVSVNFSLPSRSNCPCLQVADMVWPATAACSRSPRHPPPATSGAITIGQNLYKLKWHPCQIIQQTYHQHHFLHSRLFMCNQKRSCAPALSVAAEAVWQLLLQKKGLPRSGGGNAATHARRTCAGALVLFRLLLAELHWQALCQKHSTVIRSLNLSLGACMS